MAGRLKGTWKRRCVSTFFLLLFYLTWYGRSDWFTDPWDLNQSFSWRACPSSSAIVFDKYWDLLSSSHCLAYFLSGFPFHLSHAAEREGERERETERGRALQQSNFSQHYFWNSRGVSCTVGALRSWENQKTVPLLMYDIHESISMWFQLSQIGS